MDGSIQYFYVKARIGASIIHDYLDYVLGVWFLCYVPNI